MTLPNLLSTFWAAKVLNKAVSPRANHLVCWCSIGPERGGGR